MKQKYYILFGLGPAGLFLSRQLKKESVKIYGIAKPDDIGQYSNAIDKCFICETSNDIKNAVWGLLKTVSDKVGAFICSDGYLSMLIDEFPEAFELLDFSEPNEKTLRLIAQKDKLMAMCEKCGVRFPKVYSASELESIAYPVVVKPNTKQTTSPIPKVSFVNSKTELLELIRKAELGGIQMRELVIQQAIVGDNMSEYGYGGYFKEGKPISTIYFMQVRQYPQGVSCYTVEITDSSVKSQIDMTVKPFLRELNYTGFLQFDLKGQLADNQGGVIYVLDINPRVWGSVGMLGKRYSDKSIFTGIATNHQQIRWRFPLKEIFSFRNKKNVPYSKCKQLLTNNHLTVIDLYDKQDLKPFFMQPMIFLKKLFKIFSKDKAKLT